MKIIIKSKPEDFSVEEIADLAFKKKGAFGVYLLEKQGWNTVGLILELSKRLGVPLKFFSYGGKKDRHADTRQYISIKGKRVKEIKEKDFSLSFVGFSDRPMGPDLIKANKFQINVRRLSEAHLNQAIEELEIVNLYGYPNYFDDQRFGSFDKLQGFLAEKLLKGHFNGALKIYLTSVYAHDESEAKQRKRYFSDNWLDWEKCRKEAKTGFEKKAFDLLIKEPKGFLSLLKTIPREKLSIYFSAYQAFIWNEILRFLLKESIDSQLNIYPGIAGDYLFFSRLSKEEYAYLKVLSIPTFASKVKIPEGLCAKFYSKILEERSINNAMFNKLKTRQAFFKSTPRKTIIKPENVSFQIGPDEQSVGKMKLILKFILPRASYATMFLKRLFIFSF